MWEILLTSESNEDKYKDRAACQEKFDSLMATSHSIVSTETSSAWFIDLERLGRNLYDFNPADPLTDGIQATFTEGRYFFGGEKGWYGIGEGHVEVGDKLVLLFPDANLPFILKEKDGSYEMIGIAYVPEEAKNAEVVSRPTEFKKFTLI